MRIEELSVGDWVRTADQDIRGSRECIIQSIERWSNGDVLVVRFKDGGIETLGIGCFSPISLTTGILEKYGLEYENDGNEAIIFMCCDMFWARLCVGDTHWKIGIHSEDIIDSVVCNIKYVHQLQHALRLAGIEKEIVL